jgi:hypothetical protein
MRKFGGARTLLQVLEGAKGSGCQDPRDRIYAIIRLAEDEVTFRESIPIEYNRPISRVTMDVAWAVQQRPRLDRDYVSRICSLLDDIFEDCSDFD